MEMASLSPDRVLLLGPLQVIRNGAQLPLPPSRKVRALLAYLATAPRPVTREKLCELLWDVADDPRSELRWCLSKLRPLVDSPTATRLIADRELVRIDTNSLDIDALSLARSAQITLASGSPEDLQSLRALVRGDFLEGLAVDRAPLFDNWLAGQRHRFSRLRQELLERLSVALPPKSDDRIEVLRESIEVAPFDEAAHVELVRTLLLRALHAEAERQIDASIARFQTEGIDATSLKSALAAVQRSVSKSAGINLVEADHRDAPASQPAVRPQGPLIRVITFGQFRLLPRQRLLLDQGKAVHLGSRALEILTTLIEHAGEVVPKDKLVARVWPGTLVDDTSLRVHVSAIRKALRDGLEGARYISNVPGRGYSFVAPLEAREEPAPPGEIGPAPVAPFAILPAQLTRIVGRDEIIRGLVEELARHRLMMITGVGGIGKTTVALAVARQLSSSYRDGAFFADLAPVSEPSFVAGALAATLGVALHRDDPLPKLAAALQQKQMLIVLDSCEHVIDAAAELTAALLRYTSEIRFLATSREALRVGGECVWFMPPLDAPAPMATLSAADALRFPAVQLFVERAAETRCGYSLSDSDAPFVAEICRKLDGIALAIELAAGRTDTISVRDLAAQIDDRFRLLRHGRRTASPRHQTLRAMLDWSYDRLAGVERLLLRRLSIFNGPFTFAAASQVCAGGEVAESVIPDGIADLVAKSMIAADLGGTEPAYRLLDTTRSYASEKLDESGEREAVASRHAAFVRALFEAAAAQWEKKPSDRWIATYVPQLGDLRAALKWSFSSSGDASVGIALTIAAVPLWSQLSLVDESRDWVERAFQAAALRPEQNRRRQMQLHAALGGLQMYAISSVRKANDAWGAALALAVELGETEYQFRAIRALWAEAINCGEFRQALSFAQRFAALSASTDSTPGQIVADRLIGTTLHFLGEQRQAQEAIERMVARYDVSAARSDLVRYQFDQKVAARTIRERILWLQGRTDSALADIADNVEEALSLDHSLSLCNVLCQAACQIPLLARDEAAARRYVALLRERTAARSLDVFHTYALCFEAEIAIEHGAAEAGLSQLQSAIQELRRSGVGHSLTYFLMTLARGFVLAGRAAEAEAAVSEALSFCDRTGERWCLPELYRLRGEIAVNRRGSRAVAEAMAAVRQALALAREQGALAWELRAAMSLVRSAPKESRADALDALARAYARFNEGHRTADLIEAGALLGQAALL